MSHTLRGTGCCIFINSTIHQVPPNCWFYKQDTSNGFGLTKDEGWFDDQIMFKPEPLARLANSYTVTAEKIAGNDPWYTEKALGRFGNRGRWWNGRPVFQNDRGWFLHVGLKHYGWTIGPELGKWHVKGTCSWLSPADERNWNFGKFSYGTGLRVKAN